MYGKMMRFMRLEAKLRQTDLSRELNVSDSTLAHYESEYWYVSLEMVDKIANACEFEMIFVNKRNKKVYGFKDVERMNYDSRVKKS